MNIWKLLKICVLQIRLWTFIMTPRTGFGPVSQARQACMIGHYTIGALTKIMSLYKNVSRGDSSDPLKIISDVLSGYLGIMYPNIRNNRTCLLYFSRPDYEQIWTHCSEPAHRHKRFPHPLLKSYAVTQ